MKPFESKVQSFFSPKIPKKEFNTEAYIESLMNNDFELRFNLGVCEIDGISWLLKDFQEEPNVAFVGGMGSGKSQGCKFTLITWLLSNNDRTTLFLVDIKKSAQDYAIIHNLENVHVADDEISMLKVIDLVYDEYNERDKLFKSVGANGIETYEKITNEKVDRVLIMFEEFHAISQPILNYNNEFGKKGSPAFKFHELMRLGRSHGVWFFVCSQRSTDSDIPSKMKINFTNRMMFRCDPYDAKNMINNDAPSKILSTQKGRCFNQFGEVQFPYFEDQDIQILLDYFLPKRPYQGKNAYLSKDLITQYLGGKTTREFYRFKKFRELVSIFESNVDAQLIISMFFEEMGNHAEELDMDFDQHGLSHIVTWGDDNPQAGVRCAIMIKPEKDKVGNKHAEKLIKGMIEHKCQRGIIISGASTPSATVHKFANANKIEIMDLEDLEDQARLIDAQRAKNIKLKFAPDQLADDSKESGEYQEREENKNDSPQSTPEKVAKKEKKKENFEDPFDEIVSFMEVIESNPDVIAYKESQNKKTEKKEKKEEISEDNFFSNKGIKRPPLNKLFKIKSSDNPSLLVSCLKTETGEIFRVLFAVMKNKKVIHTYAVDRKVNSQFPYEYIIKLGIDNNKEWNADSFTFDQDFFISEINSFLENFNISENTIPVICWKEDEEFVEEFICEHHTIKDEASIIEEIAEAQYQVQQSKNDLRKLVGTNSDYFYGEILQDADLWNQL